MQEKNPLDPTMTRKWLKFQHLNLSLNKTFQTHILCNHSGSPESPSGMVAKSVGQVTAKNREVQEGLSAIQWSFSGQFVNCRKQTNRNARHFILISIQYFFRAYFLCFMSLCSPYYWCSWGIYQAPVDQEWSPGSWDKSAPPDKILLKTIYDQTCCRLLKAGCKRAWCHKTNVSPLQGWSKGLGF